jgi:hypothetical protein
MKLWCTEIKALCPHTGEMKTWGGDDVAAPTWELAQQWCNENKGYLKVIGELIAEIPSDAETYEADFAGRVDWEVIQSN